METCPNLFQAHRFLLVAHPSSSPPPPRPYASASFAYWLLLLLPKDKKKKKKERKKVRKKERKMNSLGNISILIESHSVAPSLTISLEFHCHLLQRPENPLHPPSTHPPAPKLRPQRLISPPPGSRTPRPPPAWHHSGGWADSRKRHRFSKILQDSPRFWENKNWRFF